MRKPTNPFPPYAAVETRAGTPDRHRETSMLRVWQRHAAAQQSLWNAARWRRAIMTLFGRLHGG